MYHSQQLLVSNNRARPIPQVRHQDFLDQQWLQRRCVAAWHQELYLEDPHPLCRLRHLLIPKHRLHQWLGGYTWYRVRVPFRLPHLLLPPSPLRLLWLLWVFNRSRCVHIYFGFGCVMIECIFIYRFWELLGRLRLGQVHRIPESRWTWVAQGKSHLHSGWRCRVSFLVQQCNTITFMGYSSVSSSRRSSEWTDSLADVDSALRMRTFNLLSIPIYRSVQISGVWILTWNSDNDADRGQNKAVVYWKTLWRPIFIAYIAWIANIDWRFTLLIHMDIP